MRFLRGWMIWAALGVCALMVLGAIVSLTKNVIHSEQTRIWYEGRLDLLADMRLALWRMDGAATAWINEEAQRPVLPSAYPEETKSEEAQPEVLLRFEARDDGAVVTDNHQKSLSMEDHLEIRHGQPNLYTCISQSMPPVPSTWASPPPKEPEPAEEVSKRENPASQKVANVNELNGRGRAVNRALGQSQQLDNVVNNWDRSSGKASAFNNSFSNWQLIQSGLPRPAWIKGELFLLRHLQWRMPNGRTVRTVQGSWVDGAALQKELLKEVTDLFPSARLVPATPKGTAEGMTLASFPEWELDPQMTVDADAPLSRAFWLTIGTGWVAALIAIATASLLVTGVIRLSDRRASFVSAVTHELRTPLTTFRLYSDMLESGAVREEKRLDYVKVLSREADRLAHLVENVLAFSRIERGSARAAVREVSVRDLLEPLRERMEARLSTAGMELRMNLHGPSAETLVKIDAASVEHILFNLVDNAAKYACSGDPAEVTIRAVAKAETISIHVEDNGPGIPAAKHARIFQPFHKSARDAAESRPGVGLGLALSRRLARDLGGDLLYEWKSNKSGSIFTLSLPLV